MVQDNPKFFFPKAEQYAFLFENTHLVLLSFPRDDTKFLFLLNDQGDGGLELDYPGEVFTTQVLDRILNIFKIQVNEEAEDSETSQQYILGSYFTVAEQPYGAYYQKDILQPEVLLFRFEGDPPTQKLIALEGEEFEKISSVFLEQHEDLLEIGGMTGR
ncbi:hypothetical protein D2Q93_02910 [Alicyclobacillaceae bacterium I2511]|nr:hypothetical protein D2Q93_02910 [Alicyclobacillaceae bacterium I2511]